MPYSSLGNMPAKSVGTAPKTPRITWMRSAKRRPFPVLVHRVLARDAADRSFQKTVLSLSDGHVDSSTDGSCDWLNFSKASRTASACQPGGTNSRS